MGVGSEADDSSEASDNDEGLETIETRGGTTSKVEAPSDSLASIRAALLAEEPEEAAEDVKAKRKPMPGARLVENSRLAALRRIPAGFTKQRKKKTASQSKLTPSPSKSNADQAGLAATADYLSQFSMLDTKTTHRYKRIFNAADRRGAG